MKAAMDSPKNNPLDIVMSVISFLRYNASNVFAGKFTYFLVMAVLLFLTIVVIFTIEESTGPGVEDIYFFLMAPAILLLFYPSAYSIQGDIDCRMIETLFAIPDYRYKVWVARNITQYLVISFLLSILALFCQLALADIPIVSMMFHLFFPIMFLGSVGFMISTFTRSGNGTAAVLVMIILFFWISTEELLDGSRWDLFHNPFADVDLFELQAHEETTFYNRVYLLVGSVVSTLAGLLRLQKREKFV